MVECNRLNRSEHSEQAPKAHLMDAATGRTARLEFGAAGKTSRLGAALVIAIAVFHGAMRSALSYDESSDDQKTIITQRDTQGVEWHRDFIEKIIAVENAFARLEADVLPNLDKHVPDGKIRAVIRKIFEVFGKNRTNSNRLKKPVRVPFRREDGFRYDVSEPLAGLRLVFNGAYRKIIIPEDFSPRDMMTASFLAHELMHVVVDDERRSSMSEDRYFNYWDTTGREGADRKNVVIFDEEKEAMAVHMWILNAATQGRLRRDVLAGREPQVPSADPKVKEFLRNMAIGYFALPPAEFFAYLKSIYRRVPNIVEFTPQLTRAQMPARRIFKRR